ncbi:FadR/GntR family transcriptional regulator [Streptomyces rugosispiralis]|uniref:FCD domain-containing protein n=1 Tax=Streptomyces rugosispiralis TaxID=2967341 RepID=A0ABT1V6Q2_9ACTN|nr:FCD domain-containing protein [Streptomyces rugosispiralis]MCQ8192703.1 FCD domain-containing protein [Streptomyces rugosispiralis]
MEPGRGGKVRKPQMVVDGLLARARSGEWQTGTRLPSERDLAVEFSVSRAAVREALQILQLSGHIETRLGEGSFVAEPPMVTGGTQDDAGLVAGMSISEALEAREAVELSSALMAIRRATRSDLLKLQAVVAELEEHLEQEDYKSYLLSTLDLHILVAKASHNAYLIRVVTELTDRHRDDQWLVHEHYTPDVAAFSFEVHRQLVEAIVNKDELKAIEATTRHYEDYPVLSGRASGSAGGTSPAGAA